MQKIMVETEYHISKILRLEEFLNEKPLYYTKIDYTRMPRVYEKIKSHMPNAKIIHLVGTNAKGTTGRFLASALHNIGSTCGHYTSPHILDFNERIWLNGKNVDNEKLEKSHTFLLSILSKDDASTLSYFEYTTFLAMIVFKGIEYIVLEAGLGGEFDATAVFDKVLTLVTPIDIDHEAFLGDTIQEIAKTKLNAIENNAILAYQKYAEVYEIARTLRDKKSLNIFNVEECINTNDMKKIKNISTKLKLVFYLSDNLTHAISALNFLEIKYTENNFKNARLFGRLSELEKNILVDVGHNTLAASSILKALKGDKYILIYNSYKDKDYKQILQILRPIISHIEIIEINDTRIVKKELLYATLKDLEIEYTQFKKIEKNYKYLVFGSFSVVESFIKVHR